MFINKIDILNVFKRLILTYKDIFDKLKLVFSLSPVKNDPLFRRREPHVYMLVVHFRSLSLEILSSSSEKISKNINIP